MIKVPNAWRRDEEVQLKRWGWDSHEIASLVVDLVVRDPAKAMLNSTMESELHVRWKLVSSCSRDWRRVKTSGPRPCF